MFDSTMNQSSMFSRRQLLGGIGLIGVSSGLTSPVHASKKAPNNSIHLAKDMTILFQGDSITDAGRQNRKEPKPNDQKSMGNGYASMAAGSLLASRPHLNLTIFNRGISGNKVYQLNERWQTDCLEHQPDILSILIGVNDIWHGLNGRYDGTVQKFEDDYMSLLERTRKILPNVQLVICEPFVLRCGAVNKNWFPEFDHYRASAKKVATRYLATFVPFQAMFDRAINYAPAQHWAGDGVHPTAHGAALMADFWLQAVRG